MEEAFNNRTVQELGTLRGAIKKISGYRHHVVGHVIGFFVLVALFWIVLLAIKYEPSVREFVMPHATESPSHGSKPPG
jgi:hypothetical protein